jgi:isopentenyl-diphosphate delta-isomerase
MNPASSQELVVLLDDGGRSIGSAPKSDVHHRSTPLHLAFSCYLFGDAGRLLVTRRALDKRTFPGVWTNSFCGHPTPDEFVSEAVVRRTRQELGVGVTDLRCVLPQFRYHAFASDGVVENEVCPVFLGRAVGTWTPIRRRSWIPRGVSWEQLRGWRRPVGRSARGQSNRSRFWRPRAPDAVVRSPARRGARRTPSRRATSGLPTVSPEL